VQILAQLLLLLLDRQLLHVACCAGCNECALQLPADEAQDKLLPRSARHTYPVLLCPCVHHSKRLG
jgi:hypothetical protein